MISKDCVSLNTYITSISWDSGLCICALARRHVCVDFCVVILLLFTLKVLRIYTPILFTFTYVQLLALYDNYLFSWWRCCCVIDTWPLSFRCAIAKWSRKRRYVNAWSSSPVSGQLALSRSLRHCSLKRTGLTTPTTPIRRCAAYTGSIRSFRHIVIAGNCHVRRIRKRMTLVDIW